MTGIHLQSYPKLLSAPNGMAMSMPLPRYLAILRNVHDALDLQLALDHAKGCLPGHVQGDVAYGVSKRTIYA